MAYGYPFQQPFYGGQMMNTAPQPMTQALPPMGQQAQPGTLFARFVTGREEAVAAQVIPDGNLNVFVDSNNGRIYTKAVAVNGMSDFREYAFQQPQPKAPEEQGVTMEMFMELRSEVEAIKQTRRTKKEMTDE